MKRKVILYTTLGLVGLFALAVGSEFLGIGWLRFFGPKRESARREVFKATRSWNEAKEQELLKLRLEYIRETDPITKEALAFTIRHKFADYPVDRLDTPELQDFLSRIKEGRQ